MSTTVDVNGRTLVTPGPGPGAGTRDFTSPSALHARIADLEKRVTALEALLSARVAGFLKQSSAGATAG